MYSYNHVNVAPQHFSSKRSFDNENVVVLKFVFCVISLVLKNYEIRVNLKIAWPFKKMKFSNVFDLGYQFYTPLWN